VHQSHVHNTCLMSVKPGQLLQVMNSIFQIGCVKLYSLTHSRCKNCSLLHAWLWLNINDVVGPLMSNCASLSRHFSDAKNSCLHMLLDVMQKFLHLRFKQREILVGW